MRGDLGGWKGVGVWGRCGGRTDWPSASSIALLQERDTRSEQIVLEQGMRVGVKIRQRNLSEKETPN